jgi:uncharacterized protein YktA (UPF0223 family)
VSVSSAGRTASVSRRIRRNLRKGSGRGKKRSQYISRIDNETSLTSAVAMYRRLKLTGATKILEKIYAKFPTVKHTSLYREINKVRECCDKQIFF